VTPQHLIFDLIIIGILGYIAYIFGRKQNPTDNTWLKRLSAVLKLEFALGVFLFFLEYYVRDMSDSGVNWHSYQIVMVLFLLVSYIHENAENLEAIVEERTRDLLEAERMAALGKVVSMVSHDLRGPLQKIRNLTYLLEHEPHRSGEYLDMINDSVLFSVDILDDLREHTRDEPLTLIDVEVSRLLEQVISDSVIPENVEVQLTAPPHQFRIDYNKMRRVLWNLVKNACEAMPDGGVLKIDAKGSSSGLIIDVSDTGAGVPEDFQDKLFMAFNTTKGKGMGLGLAYSKRTVEQHGGTIGVETEVGIGTTFRIHLPSDVRADLVTDAQSVEIVSSSLETQL
jgi:signal transduction histidine kinase